MLAYIHCVKSVHCDDHVTVAPNIHSFILHLRLITFIPDHCLHFALFYLRLCALTNSRDPPSRLSFLEAKTRLTKCLASPLTSRQSLLFLQLGHSLCSPFRPYLHLCGHDFTGYGVTWRSGVVFSNAAVQLTSTYPRVIPYYPFPRRRKAYSSTFSGGGVVGSSSSCGDKDPSIRGPDLFAGASAPSKVTVQGGVLGLTGDVTTLPPRIPRFNDIGIRPRRWRRRLSSILGRLSLFLSTHSLTEGPHPLSSYYGRVSSRIQPTPSSVAALRSGDGDFVVDPTFSVFGKEAGGSGGGSRSGYIGRRNPLVFDVYVVIEEGVNDREVLPDYSKKSPPVFSESAPPERQQSDPRALIKGTACCLQ